MAARKTYTTGLTPVAAPVFIEDKDLVKVAGHVYSILGIMNMDLHDPSIKDTPMRFAKYLQEFARPFDSYKVIGEGFEAKGASGMVTQSRIPFRMICEHHLLPAQGSASIGYIPRERVAGLSKLARLVDAVGCERPSLQELITDKVADILYDVLEATGVIVVMEAEHACMGCRGINRPGVKTSTSSVRGVFRDVPQARSEFFSLINHNHS